MTLSGVSRRRGAFSLVEVLVAFALLALLMLLLVSITDVTRKTWTSTSGKIEQFRAAREAFQALTRRLSDATLNTYWDYERTNDTPVRYIRQSELRFLCGPGIAASSEAPPRPGHSVFFQAPLGYTEASGYAPLKSLLNTWGYFLEFSDDSQLRPPFITSQIVPLRYRFRLMEMMEPSEELALYKFTSGKDGSGSARTSGYTDTNWFTEPLAKRSVPKRALAENIVALVFLPRFAEGEKRASGALFAAHELAPKYRYDSTESKADPELNPKNQLPPIIQVTMVAVDEASYNRLQQGTTMPALYPEGLFTNASNYEDDLKTLVSALVEKKLNYRVFTTQVSVKSAKWSQEQKN